MLSGNAQAVGRNSMAFVQTTYEQKGRKTRTAKHLGNVKEKE
jgi:hypothetical protein